MHRYSGAHHLTTHLTLAIDSYDPTAGLVHCCHKDGFTTDPVHVDASACLKVIEMDIAKLGDEVDHIVLSTDLEGERQS